MLFRSFDSDFFQLINENVSVLRYRGEASYYCDEKYIQEKFHISPIQYVDYKALTGDSSDNIRGADKIGPKTAAALLHQYGDLDTILANLENIAKPSIRESLKISAQRLSVNVNLIQPDKNASIPYPLHDLNYHDCGLTTMQVLRATDIAD